MLLDLLLKAETQTMMFLNTMKWFVKSLNLIKPLNIRRQKLLAKGIRVMNLMITYPLEL